MHGLGIEQLACLIGNSMGGMSALGYLVLHPGSARAHISIDTAPQAQPFAIAIRSLQREAIRLDPQWNEGGWTRTNAATTTTEHYPETGMSIARKLGVITYRSAMEWVGRFARIRLDPEQREDEPFGPNSRSSPIWTATPAGSCAVSIRTATCTCRAPATGSTSPNTAMAACWRALKRIHIERALVIGVSTDILFPL